MQLTPRIRFISFAVVTVAALAIAATVFLQAAGEERRARSIEADPAERTDVASMTATGPYIVFRHAADDADWGKVAMVPVADPGGPRAVLPQRCERVAAAREEPGRLSCLDAGDGVLPSLQLRTIGGTDFGALGDVGLAGIVASRTRMSAAGTRASSTTFVTGDSYQHTGEFSTRTRIYDVAADGSPDLSDSVDLEELDVFLDGEPRDEEARNFWGVTFESERTFFVTMGVGDDTWLMHGDLDEGRLDTVTDDVECPSISPDGSHLAFKRRTAAGDGWRFEVMDLESMTTTVLGETESVDDQLAWLDDDTVMYAKARPSQRADRPRVFDVYAADIDGSPPRLLIAGAESPTVVDAT